MSPNDADGMTNSVDPDQTDLYTVCPDLIVRKIRKITVNLLPMVLESNKTANSTVKYHDFPFALAGTLTLYYNVRVEKSHLKPMARIQTT